MTLAPAVVGKAEVEVPEHAADRDVPDRPRARQILAFDRGQPLMRLAHLAFCPTGPTLVFGPYRLIRGQDYRVGDAVAQGLLAQCRPSRRSGGGEEFSAGCHIVEVFADNWGVEQDLTVVRYEARDFHQ